MRHRRRRDKRTAQVRHAKIRAFQRYSVVLYSEEYDELVEAIQKNKAKFIWKESNRLSHWEVVHQGTKMLAVYDKLRKSICTFLPISKESDDQADREERPADGSDTGSHS